MKPLPKSANCWSCCNLQDLVMPNLSSLVRPSKIAHRCQQAKIIPPHGPNFSVDKLFSLKGDIYQFGHHHCHRGSTSLEVCTLEQCTEPGVSYHWFLFYVHIIQLNAVLITWFHQTSNQFFSPIFFTILFTNFSYNFNVYSLRIPRMKLSSTCNFPKIFSFI